MIIKVKFKSYSHIITVNIEYLHFNPSDDREARFAASRMAVVTVMRSWPGIIRFCRPDGAGLQSLIGILYLPFVEIRVGIFYEIID